MRSVAQRSEKQMHSPDAQQQTIAFKSTESEHPNKSLDAARAFIRLARQCSIAVLENPSLINFSRSLKNMRLDSTHDASAGRSATAHAVS